jgi:hypothetical protein
MPTATPPLHRRSLIAVRPGLIPEQQVFQDGDRGLSKHLVFRSSSVVRRYEKLVRKIQNVDSGGKVRFRTRSEPEPFRTEPRFRVQVRVFARTGTEVRFGVREIPEV